jgi:glyoxylase-like metal-dependent hydrolase (beta-lactamase superfamily II)
MEPSAIKAILLTHGHLDHAGNLAWLRVGPGRRSTPIRWSRPVDGTITGITRWCGRLERRKPPSAGARIDVHLADGDRLPFWGGLEVLHLPGHTVGHCAFYSARHDLLFSGDLFASYFFNPHLPPAILNSQPELLLASLRRVQELAPRWMIPCHYDWLDGALHRRRFDRLAARVLAVRLALRRRGGLENSASCRCALAPGGARRVPPGRAGSPRLRRARAGCLGRRLQKVGYFTLFLLFVLMLIAMATLTSWPLRGSRDGASWRASPAPCSAPSSASSSACRGSSSAGL